MRIRTIDNFTSKVADQLAWRRKELTELKALVEGSGDNHVRQSMLIRAGVALLYAHWEGFVKGTGAYLLEFVSEQRLTHAELQPNFISVILRKRLNIAKQSKKVSTTGEMVDFFCTKMQSRANIPSKDVIDTNSNLSSSVLSEILWTLGLDEKPYVTKKLILDERLVKKRNSIAHGQSLNISLEDYLSLHTEVLALIDEFRNQLENACVEKKYMRKSPLTAFMPS